MYEGFEAQWDVSFKWNEEQIKLSEILSTIDCEPLYGNKRAKTHWLVFMKASE